jgi:hypothetical protein
MRYSLILFMFFLCQLPLAKSQNLVNNPGFENHNPMICIRVVFA